jgi:hypothetical protein
MADDNADEYRKDTTETRFRYCEDCRILTEALRDMEEQRREAEDERLRGGSLSPSDDIDALDRANEAYMEKLRKLEHRRDCALEVLFKHQALDHAERS